MDRSREPAFPVAGAGLCARCAHAQVVTSGRGSRFVMCGRAREDPEFPRYPRLPVRECRGFEEKAPSGKDHP